MPPCLFPYVVSDLNEKLNLGLTDSPKCLFMTALNSVKESLANNILSLGLNAAILTGSNAAELLSSKEAVKRLKLKQKTLF